MALSSEAYSPVDAAFSVYCVIGHPVGHSMSPLIHNTAFRATRYPGVYVAFDVTDVAGAMHGLRAFGIKGASVTIPHKVAVMDLLDEIDPEAERIGAVNTIVNQDGTLIGSNTDADGAVRALCDQTEIRGKNVVIIGAGGAARAIGYGMIREGAHVQIVNRTPEKGMRLAGDLNAAFSTLQDLEPSGIDILINTTPVGMHPKVEAMPAPESIFRPGMIVMDIIYNPIETRFLKTAAENGCKIIDGVAMFVYQGAVQFSRWTGQAAPIAEMRRVVYNQLGSKR